jgi:hypothetical protein
MDGSLPSSLKHIISNAEYYGPSLFLLATDVVTAYVFQVPGWMPEDFAECSVTECSLGYCSSGKNCYPLNQFL